MFDLAWNIQIELRILMSNDMESFTQDFAMIYTSAAQNGDLMQNTTDSLHA